ncbi:hypothetical protein [Demequina soli]|uniref:hypothetical protein n=1 Tax=Demequina soli TaxID=1638987 RepID=UPI0007865658|nr:hypothetical protein [Demequina soli]
MTGIPGGRSLHALVFAVLEHGVGQVARPEGLATSLIEETGTGDRTIKTFTGAGVETTVRAARDAAKRSTAERVALLWDGQLTGADGDEHAVMVLAQERGQDRTLVFAQRYTFEGVTVEPVGRPGFVGDREALLG